MRRVTEGAEPRCRRDLSQVVDKTAMDEEEELIRDVDVGAERAETQRAVGGGPAPGVRAVQQP